MKKRAVGIMMAILVAVGMLVTPNAPVFADEEGNASIATQSVDAQETAENEVEEATEAEMTQAADTEQEQEAIGAGDATENAKEEATDESSIALQEATDTSAEEGDVDEEEIEAVCRIDGEEFESLEKAIAAAKSGDTILLVKDIKEFVTIAGKNVKIDLAGHTWNAKGGSSRKNVRVESGAQVVIQNGTLAKGKGLASDPAPIYVAGGQLVLDRLTITKYEDRILYNNAGVVNMNDSVFTGNKRADSYGMFMIVNSGRATMSMTNTKITGNTGRGLIDASGSYSYASSYNKLTLTGCDIKDNKVTKSSLYVYKSSVTLNDTTISGNVCEFQTYNYSDLTGGIYHQSGPIVMNDSAVYGNVVEASNSHGDDFCIDVEDLESGSIPLPKDMKDHGQALTGYKLFNYRYNIEMTEALTKTTNKLYGEFTVVKDENDEEPAGDGIAEYDGKAYKDIVAAVAAMDGKAGTIKILKDAKVGGAFDGHDGIVIDLDGHTLTSNGSNVIEAVGGSITVQNGTIKGAASGSGTAVYARDAHMTLKNLTVTETGGTAVYAHNNHPTSGTDDTPHNVLIEDCNFTGNGNGDNDRALYITACSAVIKNTTFDGNQKSMRFIHNFKLDNTVSLEMEGCTFKNNKAMPLEMYITEGSSCTLRNCDFVNNDISDEFVVFHETKSYGTPEMGGDLTMVNCTVKDNSCTETTVQAETGNVLLENCLIEGNKAKVAGGIFAEPFCKLTLTNTVVKNNSVDGTANYSSGGVALYGATYVIVTPGVNGSQGSSSEYGFVGSSLTMNGGAIYDNSNSKTSPAAEDLYVAAKCTADVPAVADMTDGDKDFTGLFWKNDTKTDVETAIDSYAKTARYYQVGVGQKLKQVYVDGVNGDDANPGTKAEPVKSLDAAKTLMDLYNCKVALVLDTITIEKKNSIQLAEADEEEETADPTIVDFDGKMLKRDPSFKGYLITVQDGDDVVLKNIVIDGSSQTSVQAEKSLVLVSDGGKLTLKDGATLQNNGYHGGYGYAIKEGGAVLVTDGGEMLMEGGLIQKNYGVSGGGIFVKGGKLVMTGGTIDDNTALWTRDSSKAIINGPSCGGGVLVAFGGEMIMKGGTISNNWAGRDGGGVSLGTLYMDSIKTGDKTTFKMTGGEISGNTASSAGGGLYIQCSTEATITGGTFSNNKAQGGSSIAKDDSGCLHAGGAIYINGYHDRDLERLGIEHGKLYMTNAEIANNEAKWEGGAIAWCGSGIANVTEINGTVIYDNHSSGEAKKNNPNTPYYGNYDLLIDNELWTYKNGEWSNERLENLLQEAYIAETMLNGAAYDWEDENGDVLTAKQLHHGMTAMRLNTDATAIDPDVQASVKMATVHITGNESSTNGGAIGCNGDMYIGKLPTYVDIPVEKIFDDNDDKDRVKKVKVNLLQDGKVIDSKIIKPNEEGKWTHVFEEQPEYKVDENGELTDEKHVYTVEEDMTYKPDGETAIGERYTSKVVKGDDGKFTITNTPKEEPEEPPKPEEPTEPEKPTEPEQPKTETPDEPEVLGEGKEITPPAEIEIDEPEGKEKSTKTASISKKTSPRVASASRTVRTGDDANMILWVALTLAAALAGALVAGGRRHNHR